LVDGNRLPGIERIESSTLAAHTGFILPSCSMEDDDTLLTDLYAFFGEHADAAS